MTKRKSPAPAKGAPVEGTKAKAKKTFADHKIGHEFQHKGETVRKINDGEVVVVNTGQTAFVNSEAEV
jgi:hypothetical protein